MEEHKKYHKQYNFMYSNKKFVYQLCSTLLLKHKLYLMLIKFVFPLRTYWVLTKLKFTCAPVSLTSTIYFKSHKIHNFCYMHFIPVKVKKKHTHTHTRKLAQRKILILSYCNVAKAGIIKRATNVGQELEPHTHTCRIFVVTCSAKQTSIIEKH